MLGTLQDNGGPTPTCAPLPGSRAIDKGVDSGGAPTDQRGFRRTFDDPGVANAPGGDGTDVGAVEVGSPDFVFVVGADHSLTQTSYTGSVQLSPAGTVLAATSSLDFTGDGYVVFAITSDSHLWRHGAAGWAMLSAGSFQSVSAAANSSGKAVVFGVLTDDSLWENSSQFGGDGWRNLSPAGTILSISAIQDVSNADLVFAVTANHQLWEHTPAGWSLLSAGNFLSISAGLNAASQAEVFGVLADNSLWEHNPASRRRRLEQPVAGRDDPERRRRRPRRGLRHHVGPPPVGPHARRVGDAVGGELLLAGRRRERGRSVRGAGGRFAVGLQRRLHEPAVDQPASGGHGPVRRGAAARLNRAGQ